MPRYLVKCGDCDNKIEIHFDDQILEINGVIASVENWREVLLPLLLMPLLVPVLIPSAEATRALFEADHAMRWDWLGILIAFDVVFLTALWLFGEYLLEE